MLLNYLQTSVRNLLNTKFFSLLNLLGLAIGLASSIFIWIYLQHQGAYDTHTSDHKRVWRLESTFSTSSGTDHFAMSPPPLGPTLLESYPELLENQTRLSISSIERELVAMGKVHKCEGVGFADSSFFAIFDYTFLQGQPSDCLSKDGQAVMTRSLAERLFGTSEAVGMKFSIQGGKELTVSAVLEDLPTNVHHRFECLVSIASIENMPFGDHYKSRKKITFWLVSNYTFVKFQKGKGWEDLESVFPDYYQTWMEDSSIGFDVDFELYGTPIADMHFSQKSLEGDAPKGNDDYLWIFAAVGIFTLLIAAINYMNLTTARASTRSKEVGIRKVLGSSPAGLAGQFLLEAVMLATLALLLALGLVESLLPAFNELTEIRFAFEDLLNLRQFSLLLGATVLLGLFAGSYPAAMLAKVDPVQALKSRAKLTHGSASLRRGLVVLQFTLSSLMILGTSTISKQIDYMQNRPLGFDKSRLLGFRINFADSALIKRMPEVVATLGQSPLLESVSSASNYPGFSTRKQLMSYQKPDGTLAEKTLNNWLVDEKFVENLGTELLAGRSFDLRLDTLENGRTGAVILNRAAALDFGYTKPEDAVGSLFVNGVPLADFPDYVPDTGRVVGVVEDFNYNSLHEPVAPMVLLLNRLNFSLLVRYREGQQEAATELVRSTCQAYGGNIPTDQGVEIDRQLQRFYQSEERTNRTFGFFTFVALSIAALGLLGLSSYMISNRTREIGLRKVLGASATEVTMMFLREFGLWVLLANLLASALALPLLRHWLANFAYRVTLDLSQMLSLVLVSTGICLGMAALVVTSQVLRAANINPASALKHE